jgi:hypothetical protein
MTTGKREITVRLEGDLWMKLDDKRHAGRYKWQGLGEILFRQWLDYGLISEQNKSASAQLQASEEDWRVQTLRKIVSSANVTATAALEAHLISADLLVSKQIPDADGEYDNSDADTDNALRRIDKTIQHIRFVVKGVRDSQARPDRALQGRRTA